MRNYETAVEWLEKELIKRFKRNQLHYTDSEWCFDMIKKLSKQAMETEKQQIKYAYKEGCFDNILDESTDEVRAEQYYNEKFKK